MAETEPGILASRDLSRNMYHYTAALRESMPEGPVESLAAGLRLSPGHLDPHDLTLSQDVDIPGSPPWDVVSFASHADHPTRVEATHEPSGPHPLTDGQVATLLRIGPATAAELRQAMTTNLTNGWQVTADFLRDPGRDNGVSHNGAGREQPTVVAPATQRSAPMSPTSNEAGSPEQPPAGATRPADRAPAQAPTPPERRQGPGDLGPPDARIAYGGQQHRPAELSGRHMAERQPSAAPLPNQGPPRGR